MLLKEANLERLSFSYLKVFIIKKPFDFGEVESVEDCTDENLMEMEDQSSMSLFNDYPASSVIDANESGESQITIGKYTSTARDFFFYLFTLIWYYERPHRY